MNTKNKFLGLLMVTALSVFFIQSCTKDDAGSISETDLTFARDDTYTEAMYEEVDNLVIDEVTSLDANDYSPVGLKSTSDEEPCFSVNVDFPDSTRFPKVVTIDYGDGCTMVFRGDTITRRGQIIITVTDRWFMPGAQNIVTFNEFYFNDINIQGTRTITNLGMNDEDHLEFGIKLEDGLIKFSSSEFITIEADFVREWIRHHNPQSDTIMITGSAAGVNLAGEDFSRVITEPMVLVHCDEYRWRWVIVDGTVELTNSVTGTTTIDYSAEGCDGTVIIGKNGYRHNYQFKYNHRYHNKDGW